MKVIIEDSYTNLKYYVDITDEMYRFYQWLCEEEIVTDDVFTLEEMEEIPEFTKI